MEYLDISAGSLGLVFGQDGKRRFFIFNWFFYIHLKYLKNFSLSTKNILKKKIQNTIEKKECSLFNHQFWYNVLLTSLPMFYKDGKYTRYGKFK